MSGTPPAISKVNHQVDGRNYGSSQEEPSKAQRPFIKSMKRVAETATADVLDKLRPKSSAHAQHRYNYREKKKHDENHEERPVRV